MALAALHDSRLGHECWTNVGPHRDSPGQVIGNLSVLLLTALFRGLQCKSVKVQWGESLDSSELATRLLVPGLVPM